MKTKNRIILISLCAAFVLLLTLALLGKFAWGWFDEREKEPYTPPPLEEGEAYYYLGSTQIKDVVLMYPQLNRSDLFQIRVRNTRGDHYFFYHNQAGSLNYFALGECENEDWEWGPEDLYDPPIRDSYYGTFDYTSLYDDTTTIPAMLAAVGTVMIDERIKPEDGTMTAAFLSRYGLSEADHPAYFELVTYLRDGKGDYLYAPLDEPDRLVGRDTDGKYYYLTEEGTRGEEYTDSASKLTPAADTSGTRRVYVGNRTVDDSGYYLYLEGRNTVYTTTSKYLADVVGRDMGYYIAPRLVTESESSYAYQLTPYFSIYNGNFVNTPGLPVLPGVTVGLTTGHVWRNDSDGGSGDIDDYAYFRVFDLGDATLDEVFAAALVGRNIGDTVDILLPTPNLSDMGRTVTYCITKVMGVMEDGAYLETEGRVIAGTEQVVVAYTDGTSNAYGELYTYYGCIDLSDDGVPAALVALLTGTRVGETHPNYGAGSLVYTVTYDSLAEEQYHVTVQLEEIKAVTASDGSALTRVGYDTKVEITYLFLENGETVGENTLTLTVPPAGDGEGQFSSDATWVTLYGKAQAYTMRRLVQGLLNLEVGSYVDADGRSTKEIDIPYAVEHISDFDMYRDAHIDYTNGYEEQLTFGYVNDRDVYYGSSLYEIKSPSDKSLYALDANATLNVLSKFENLIGDETVEVGLGAETFRDYCLYDYRLTYELPFDCYAKENGSKTNYYHKTSIVYNLYISRTQKDGSRYVGSDQYDIVVRVEDGSLFDFVEWDFATRWMQNNLLMVSYENLRGMVFDLNFAEEEYNRVLGFDICVDRNYKYPSEYYQGGELKVDYTELPRLYASVVDGGAHTGTLTYRQMRNIFLYNSESYNPAAVPEGQRKEIRAGRYIQTVSDTLAYVWELQNGRDLDEVYGYRNSFHETDMDGSYYMRTILQILNGTCFWGNASEELTETEIAALLADPDACTMSLALTLCDEAGTEYGYTMRFYNYSMHSLVSITDERNGTVSTLFYVQSREVMKLARAVVALANGQEINPDLY